MLIDISSGCDQLTISLMFTSIPGVGRRCFTQVVLPPSVTARCNGVRPSWSGYNSSINMLGMKCRCTCACSTWSSTWLLQI